MRTKYLEEMSIAMALGFVIVAIVFGLVHNIFSGVIETIVFMVATWEVAVYVVWTVIAVFDERGGKNGK